jgi:LmbE family N-acetylglucosaminyl deacetylase
MYRRAESGVAFYTYFHSVPAADDVEHCLPRLTAALRDSAATTDSDTLVFCPAGTGSHVDHVLTRRAVEQLVDAERIIYYDEYPYSARPAASSTPEDVPDSWVQYKLALSAEETELRVAAIGCYASQLRGLFPSGAERLREIASARVPLIGRWFVRPPNVHASRRRMAARVIRDTSHLGGERYWLSPQCASPFPKS